MDSEKGNEVQSEVDNEILPRPLHLTKAIYIRHISPTVAPSDILEVIIQQLLIFILFW